jgi:CelD/BcsL family acetyltransferase involved in cellulose biosynthesis
MALRVHQDWDSPGFDLTPLAAAMGPFPRRPFLETWWRHRGSGLELMLVESPGALLPLARFGDHVGFLGEPDLTDYHCPLGKDVEQAVADLVPLLSQGEVVVLDSLPVEAMEAIRAGMAGAGAAFNVEEHAVSAVLDLGSSFGHWLDAIGKKERHEIRRKRRRYEEVLGPIVHETHFGAGFGFEQFVSLHRRAAGEKASFMTDEMRSFFADLTTLPGWRIDLLAHGEAATACLFGYTDDSGYYLYNSSYDPDLAAASPGQVLLSSMIERATEEGRSYIDFLKGEEDYKFRLGARRRALYRVEAKK